MRVGIKYVTVPAQVHRVCASIKSHVLLLLKHVPATYTADEPPVSNRMGQTLQMCEPPDLGTKVVMLQAADCVFPFFDPEPLGCGREIRQDEPGKLSSCSDDLERNTWSTHIERRENPSVMHPSTKAVSVTRSLSVTGRTHSGTAISMPGDSPGVA